MAASEHIAVAHHRTRSFAVTSWSTLGVCLIVFVVALAPRALAIGRFVTVDEAYHWFDRAEVFLRAVQNGAYRDTDLVGHPGVTTMWLGAIGVLLHRTLDAWGWSSLADVAAHRALVRLPVAIATALCVTLAYPLLRRLLDARAALVAVLLWATDPFVVAHSQLLHVDALLASFITLALLAALLAFRIDTDAPATTIRWRALVASGVAGGLALLTKSPSVILLPMLGMIGVMGRQDTGHRTQDTGDGERKQKVAADTSVQSSASRIPHPVSHASCLTPPVSRLSFLIWPLLVWLLTAAIVWVALWPAAWVELPRTVRDVFVQAESDGGSPHAWGNFFLGQSVADPGPLFYPVAIALRSTPWTFIGLLAACVALFRRGFASKHTRVLLLLIAFILLFTVMMSIPPKKFDRYILPVFPALDIIAAAGLVWLAELANRWSTKREGKAIESQKARAFVSVGWKFAAFAIVAGNIFWYHPYELSYYNQLFGGGAVAARLIPVGWGEGYEQVGAYISSQPDGSERPVAAWFAPVLSPFVPDEVGPLHWALLPSKVDYAVLYIDQIQRNDEPETTATLLGKQQPVFTVRIHGIDYAYVYRIPPPVVHPLDADVGSAIHLRGYDLDTSALRSGGFITLTLQWQARTQVGMDYNLFVHVLDAAGERIGQADVFPGGEHAPTSAWNAGRYVSLVQRIPVQADAQSGSYWIALGVYDPTSFARLPVRGDTPPGAPNDGENALLLGPITLR